MKKVLTLVLATLLPSVVSADVRLPGFFGDHMVLQQEMPISIWGWADAGENVSVTVGSSSATATASGDGKWSVKLPAMKASLAPVSIVVEGANRLEVNDVLIGEVWLCSGQSNMEWTVASSTSAAKEIASASHPLIRQMKVTHRQANEPLDDLPAEWHVCSPETVGGFTACGYFMARKLHAELEVPIGLVNSSWGGTRIEPWTPPVGFQKVEALDGIYQSVRRRTPGTSEHVALLKGHINATKNWLQDAEKSLADSSLPTTSPAFPAELTPYKSHQDPTMLYNGMIHALVGFPIRGAIWYQGESNHADGLLYLEKKKALINGWRQIWGQGDFPFYYVQIAPFQYGTEDPSILAKFWEAQAAVQEIKNTGMVVINDIATLNNIHPPNKQDVGARLANLALKNDYGRDVVADSPEFAGVQADGPSLRITFEQTGGGLKTRDGQPPTHFEIVGPGSGGFRRATAVIEGDSVVLTADGLSQPTAMRFAWHKLAEPNLTGGTGLPVGAFRAGDVPSFADGLPIAEWQLVYDLDLSKLAADVSYDVDRSPTAGKFNRVAYLLELTPSGGAPQGVFAAMDAFTDDAAKVGIPTVSSDAKFQQQVTNLSVLSTDSGLTTDNPVATANIEFWPNNYGPDNVAGVKNANGGIYDFGDAPGPPEAGYGSMQLHNFGTKNTIFAINHWKNGRNADIGIGNSEGRTRDWTFTGNAAQYEQKRLRVFVK